MRRVLSRSIITLFLWALCLHLHAHEACIEIRAAFDVGSGSTKMKVARVDTCKKKIVEVLQEKQLPIQYKDDLEQQKKKYQKNEFSPHMMERGLHALVQLKASAKYYHPDRYEGVATAAFREAENAEQFVARLKEETGIDLNIISQADEAKLGFWATIYKLNLSPESVVVWDIGGASMQLTAKPTNTDSYAIYRGKMASVSFKNLLIDTFRAHTMPRPNTPNPLTKVELHEAVILAKDIALKTIPQDMQTIIRAPHMTMVGIGNVHLKNIQQNIDSETDKYDTQELEILLDENANLRDDEIEGKYPSTTISNMALVLGFMQALHIEKVYTPSIDLSDGVLLHGALPNWDAMQAAPIMVSQ